MQTIANMVHTTVFSYITVTGNLIGCDSLDDSETLADYACLVIQKVADEVMINLDAEEFAVYVNAAEELAIWEESLKFH